MRQRYIAIIDPALGISKGHHAGFAEMVTASCPKNIKVKYFINQALDNKAEKKLQSPSISVVKIFSQDFYQYYQQHTNAVEIKSYITILAREFMVIFKQLIATGQEYLLLYHTLSWEHLNALSLALQMLDSGNNKLQHKVLLMFNPGINHLGETTEIQQCLNYRIALNKLQKISSVKLFTSCTEYSNAYAQLLALKSFLPIHPALVAGGQGEIGKAKGINDISSSRILLYLGDAKSDKGFLRLPERLRWLQKECGQEAQIIIHYIHSPDWEHSELKNVEQEIVAIAKTDSRIQLYTSFWSQNEIAVQFEQAALLLLDYEQEIYAEKTSGLLWLAAYFSVPILVTENTWASREAHRLNLAVTLFLENDTLNSIEQRLKRQNMDVRAKREYRQQIFMPFWEWLEQN